jgi:prepilin-type N-terminal cleavage/methylation domain-containing protein
MRRRNNQEKGFTLLECAVVVAIVAVILSISVFSFGSVMKTYKADGARDVVLCALRQARSTALARHRDVQVWIDQSFTGTDQAQHINYQVLTLAGEPAQAMVSFELPSGSQMVLEPNVPDTPMAFGKTAAVDIGNVAGGPVVMVFRSTGAFTDANYDLLNGTIFLGVPDQAPTARAVTIMGGVADLIPYTWTGSEWIR